MDVARPGWRTLFFGMGVSSALVTAAAMGATQSDPLYRVPYNGDFTFTRIRYSGPGFGRFGGSAWSHDYPDADLAQVL